MRRIPSSRAVLSALWIQDDQAAKASIKFHCGIFPRNIRKIMRFDKMEITSALDITKRTLKNPHGRWRRKQATLQLSKHWLQKTAHCKDEEIRKNGESLDQKLKKPLRMAWNIRNESTLSKPGRKVWLENAWIGAYWLNRDTESSYNKMNAHSNRDSIWYTFFFDSYCVQLDGEYRT